MNELWIITAVVFAAVVLGVEASYWLMSHSWRAKRYRALLKVGTHSPLTRLACRMKWLVF